MLDKDNTLENKFQYDEEIFVEMQRMAPPPGFNPNFQPPKFPGGNIPGGSFPNGNIPGSNFPGSNFPDGKFPDGNFPGGNFHGGNNFPNGNFPGGNFHGGNFHGGNNFPNGNFPGGNPYGINPYNGNFNPSQLGAPPNYIPEKDAKGVQNFNSYGPGGNQVQSISQNSIRFCLFQFTYIWERGGRAYWAFLLNVDRVSVSGLRWFGRGWGYFGVDLRRIDSFICYRNNCENCQGNNLYRCSSESEFKNKKKLYTNCDVRECISKTLVSLDIPEIKDDFLIQPIGIVNGETIESSSPCVKSRNTAYTINLEITYPENTDKNIKDKIIKYANEASKETVNIINSVRANYDSINPLESFNDCTKVISKALESFSSEFNSNLRDPEIGKDIARNVTYSITQGKSTDNWQTKI